MRELSLHILDIIQNSIAAKASLVEVVIEEDLNNNRFLIQVKDNGQGMAAAHLSKITDPFVTTRQTREVGLGIPLLLQAAEQCAGGVKIDSIPGEGTVLTVYFQYDHIDRAPLGGLTETIIGLIAVNPAIDFSYSYLYNGNQFRFDTRQIKRELGQLAINRSEVLNWLKDYLKEGLKDLRR